MNRTNLKLLADYLYALPEDYEHFHMGSFFIRDLHTEDEEDLGLDEVNHQKEFSCGTAGCAVGHAPFVKGIPEPSEDDYSWSQYSYRIFEIKTYSWEWCFGSCWDDVDNTPKGAAQRIYWLLEYGLPSNHNEQIWQEEELCYLNMTPDS